MGADCLMPAVDLSDNPASKHPFWGKDAERQAQYVIPCRSCLLCSFQGPAQVIPTRLEASCLGSLSAAQEEPRLDLSVGLSP